LFTLLLTLTADLASNHVRSLLRGDAAHAASRAPQTSVAPSATVAGPSRRPWYAMGFVLAVLVWSLWFMGWGNRAGEQDAPRNHLAPAAELFTGKAWDNLRFFQRLLSPELDLPAIGVGEPQAVAKRKAEGKSVDLFAAYGPGEFWRPSAWSSWLDELRKWFVWRAVESAAVPLAIAVVGTVLGVVAAILLTYPHSAT